jgi:hypothetical protein
MKLDKITINVLRLVLILLAAFLVKLIVSTPPKTYAQIDRSRDALRYKVTALDAEFSTFIAEEGKKKLNSYWWDKMTLSERWTAVFNRNAAQRWTYQGSFQSGQDVFLVFSR